MQICLPETDKIDEQQWECIVAYKICMWNTEKITIFVNNQSTRKKHGIML